MISRRQTICSILSALYLAGCSTFQASAPARIVRVKALADPPFRSRNPGWAQEARGLIEAASDYYEEEFGIRLVTAKRRPVARRRKSAFHAGLAGALAETIPGGIGGRQL